MLSAWLSRLEKGYCLQDSHRPSFPFQVGMLQHDETARRRWEGGGWRCEERRQGKASEKILKKKENRGRERIARVGGSYFWRHFFYVDGFIIKYWGPHPSTVLRLLRCSAFSRLFPLFATAAMFPLGLDVHTVLNMLEIWSRTKAVSNWYMKYGEKAGITCLTLQPVLALVSINMTFSSLALCSPSSIMICLQGHQDQHWRIRYFYAHVLL